jgi:hypothetical protein
MRFPSPVFFNDMLTATTGLSSCLTLSGPVLPPLRRSTGTTFGRGPLKPPPPRTRSNESTTRDETDPRLKRNDIPNTRPLGFIRPRCGATQRSCHLARSHLRHSQTRLEHRRGSFHRFHFLEEPKHRCRAFRTSCSRSSSVLILTVPWCSAASNTVHREPDDLRNQGTAEQDVQLVCLGYISDPRRAPLEHVQWSPPLLQLVLDRWVPNRKGRVYVPHVHGLDPVLLHDHRTGGRGYGSDDRGRRVVVHLLFSFVLIL